ncbi:MAG: hypothetical protein HY683_01995, partial [Chloroflexi bacterium]|nr:hypothetical protein [Chloroflexota bacterium]
IATRRSSLQVVADILRIGGTKTRMMYGANLSYAQTQKYLELLVNFQLLEEVRSPNGRTTYVPSERGKKFLVLIDSMETFLDELSMPAALGILTKSGERGKASAGAVRV